MNTDSVQGRLEGFLGARVEHLVSNRGRVWVPRDENELGGWSAIVRRKLHVYKSVPTVILRQITAKILIGLRLVSLSINHNLGLVFDLVNVVAKLLTLSELERLKGSGYFVVNYDSGRL